MKKPGEDPGDRGLLRPEGRPKQSCRESVPRKEERCCSWASLPTAHALQRGACVAVGRTKELKPTERTCREQKEEEGLMTFKHLEEALMG